MKPLLIVLLLLFSVSAQAAEIEIKTAKETLSFEVEIAADDDSRAQGLMYRKEVPPGTGMLFVYPEPAYQSFWMKNTIASLDMLFMTPDGEIVFIHPNALPRDQTPVGPERDDICAVLEIAGGEAARLGIKTGDRMELTNSSACLP